MSAQTVEINSVETVLRELKPLVEEVQRTLEQSLESDQPAAGAEGVTTRLNEIRGTLELLDLEGPRLLVEEMRGLANELAQDRVEGREAALEVLLKGVFKLPDYLDRLQAGQSDRPAVLLPLINELRGARGAEALGEREVFRPQLEPVAPKRDREAEAEDAQIRATAKRLRPRFQRALLGWYRGEAIEQRLDELGTILQELAEATANPATQRLWRVCGALTESLSDQGLEQDTEVKVLMAKVERLLSQLVRQGEGALERTIPLDLLRSLLYYVARSGSDSPRVREVKQAYNLEELLPDSGAEADFEGPNRGLLEVVGQGIRDDLNSIRDSVEIYVHSEEGRPDVLEGLPDRIKQVADTFSMVGLSEDHDILRQEADGLAEIDKLDADEVHKRMQRLADVLVRADSDLTELESGRPARRKGQEGGDLAIRDLPDSEYRPLLSGVVAASLDDLSKLREAIGAYCGDPEAGHEAVAEAPTLLTELEGAVAMLPLEAALPLVRDLRGYVERELVERGVHPDEDTQVLIADVVAGLEYYLEAVDHDRAAMTHLLESAQRAMTALQQGGEPETHSEDEQVVIESPEGGEAEAATEPAAGGAEGDAAATAADAELGGTAESEVSADAGTAATTEPADEEPDLGDLELESSEAGPGADEATGASSGATDAGDAADAFDLGDLELVDTETATVEADTGGDVGGGTAHDAGDFDLELASEGGPASGGDGSADEPSAGDDALDASDLDTGDLELGAEGTGASTAAPAEQAEGGAGELDVAELETGELELGAEGTGDTDVDAHGEPDTASAELDAGELDTGDLELGQEGSGATDSDTPAEAQDASGSDDLEVADLDTGDLELADEGSTAAGDTSAADELDVADLETGDVELDAGDGPAEAELEPDAAEAGAAAEVAGADDGAGGAAEETEAGEPASAAGEAEAGADTEAAADDQGGDESQSGTGERAGPGVDPAASGSQYAIVGEDVDDEIVEVFLEEALGELDKINEYLPKWKANPSDEESLVVVRRAFHTLKGGGRLIGAELVGEFSWSMENMLNRVIDHSIDATPTLFDTLDEAAAALPQLIEQIRGNRAPIEGIDNLIQRAHALSRGEEPPPGGGGGPAGPSDPPADSGDSRAASPASEGVGASAAGSADETASSDLEVAEGAEEDATASAPRPPAASASGHDRGVGAGEAAAELLEGADERESIANALEVEEDGGEDLVLAGAEASSHEAAPDSGPAEPAGEQLEVATRDFGGDDEAEAPPTGVAESEQAPEVVPDAGEASPPDHDVGAAAEGREPAAASSDAEAESSAVHPDDVDDELLESFLQEADEILEACDAVAQRWRDQPDDPDAIPELQRNLHTLKGGARMADLAPVGELTHELESLIHAVDQGTCARSEGFFDVLQEGVDGLSAMLMQVRSRQAVPPAEQVLRRIRAVQHGDEPATPAAGAGAETPAPASETDASVAASPQPADEAEAEPQAREAGDQDESEEVDDELVESFLEEAGELIDACEQAAGRWRDQPDDGTAPDELQRHLHTLKGGARMASLGPISELTHELESVIHAVQAESCPRDERFFDALQEAVDALMTLLTQVRSGQPLHAVDDLVSRLQAVRSGADAQGAAAEGSGAPSAADARDEASDTGGDTASSTVDAGGDQAAPAAGAEDEEDSLVGVFVQEAETHQAALRAEFLDADGAPTATAKGVKGDILRALHTLVGSAETAGCDDIAAVASPMEQIAKLRRDAKSDLTEQDVTLFGEAVVTLDRMLAQLKSAPDERVDAGDLAQRLAQQRDQAQADLDATRDESEDELVDIFLEEADELLEACDQGVSRWREQPEDTEVLGELQRSLHTLKGGARMAHLPPIADLTHEVEWVIKSVEYGSCEVSEELFELLQEAVDALTVLLEQVRGRQPIARVDWLVEDLQNLRERGAGAVGTAQRAGRDTGAEPSEQAASGAETAESAEVGAGPGGDSAAASEAAPAEAQGEAQPSGKGSSARGGDAGQGGGGQAQSGSEQIRVQADLLDNLVNYAGEVSIYHSRLGEQMGQYRFNLNEFEQTVNRLREQLRQMEDETEAQILYSGEKQQQEDQPKREDFDPLEFDRYTRIQELSRSLSESVGDLDSIKEILENLTRDAETLLLQQSRVSSELQDGLMQTRMVRFDGLRARLSRVVRQTASQVGKKVQMSMTGGELEVDRSIQERVVAPLEHVLRNAVSHGIESPAERRKAGKPEQGSISLDLHRGGTDVVLEITDDGAGIDPDAVRRKAINRGLIAPDDDRDDNEVIKLILETGFSTADEVTQISGRGVGMDVVDAEIRRLGGTLGISTVKGQGTRFTVRLPVTLAINQAVLVKAGEDTYAIPIASIEGVTQVPAGDLKQYYIDPSKRLTYAEADYRVQHLGTMLGTSEPKLDDPEVSYPVIMVRSGDDRVALHIDGIQGRREVVVKPLGTPLNMLPGISGATIMADGSVVLILDAGGLLRTESRFVAAQAPAEAAAEAEEAPAEEAEEEGERTPTILVVDDSITMRKVSQRILTRHGLEVATAKDGVDAMSWMAQQVPDLILLDIEMPRMDGYEVASNVRSDDRLKDVPIIMVTSRTGDKHRQRAEDIGVNQYLGKPYQEGELMEEINALIGATEAA